jgi:hypothetical protein
VVLLYHRGPAGKVSNLKEPGERFSILSAGQKLKGCRVHTKTFVRRGWAVFEDVAKMGVATGTEHFCSYHPVTPVDPKKKVKVTDRSIKTRPSGPGFKLGIRTEKIGAAADTLVDSPAMKVMVFTGKSWFCPGLSRNTE